MNMLIALLLAAPQAAYAISPAVCEDVARASAQGNVDAYVHLAHEYPGQDVWKKYLPCEGQPLNLEEEKQVPGYQQIVFQYTYSIQCGREEMHFGGEYYLERAGQACAVVGE